MLGKLDEDEAYSSSGSDYEVESFIHPTRVRKLVNDETADLLGNFDDAKRKEIMDGTYNETHRSSSEMENSDSDSDVSSDDEETLAAVQHKYMKIEDEVAQTSANSDNGDNDEAGDNSNDDSLKEVNTNLTKDQLSSLLRGTSKANRHVLYVTNLNFETTKADLEEYFGRVGVVKSVRIPKKRRGGFAFVEMADLDGFQRGFELHNTELHTRKIKVQLSEAGKKKSANKKNIIKQKNRKLAEMRNEQKTFTKSGKFYDKTLKKEKAKEMLARKRWRKKPSSGPKTA